ncbi:MAG TPA: DnaJ domain-containing protein [Thermoanaerobaculia bacterium]|nr:DnaJ domain-containing protein [Thermoanaerobaculia bacterium]
MKVNYYELLGLQRAASDQEIRDRFRQLAREHHPDRYKGGDKSEAERRFQELTEAFNVLSNPQKRKQHDSELQPGGTRATTDFSQIARAYLAQGVKAYKEGNFVLARENFDLAVKHYPDDAKAFHYLALTCVRIPSGIRQAVQAIESAVQREPMNPVFLKDAGLICRTAGLTAKAERYLEQALEWDRENLEIQTALAELRGQKDTKEGRGLLDSLFKKG